jgi:hypothetical protein
MFIIHEHENNTMYFELDNILQQVKETLFLHLSLDEFYMLRTTTTSIS